MATIFTEEVIPLRYNQRTNVIVCKRQMISEKISELRERLAADVINSPSVRELEFDQIYAVRCLNGNDWDRVCLKFINPKGVFVLSCLDKDGLINFCPNKMEVKKIIAAELKIFKPSLFKTLIYGLQSYVCDHEFELVFDEQLRGKPVSGIFALIEQKAGFGTECYAGDFLSRFNHKFQSFRDILIREEISEPSVTYENSEINQQLFQKTLEFIAKNESNETTLIDDEQVSVAKGTTFTKQISASTSTVLSAATSTSHSTLVTLKTHFKLTRIIGEGTFGLVWQATDLLSRKTVAIKMYRSSLYGFNSRTQNLEEVRILQQLKHKNIISLLNVVEINEEIFLVFPFIPKTLENEIIDEPNISIQRVKQVMVMVLSGVAHMHDVKVVHRDIKPSNILVLPDNTIKIIDLGLAKCWDSTSEKFNSAAGTRQYQAPEMFLGEYDFKVDIWASIFFAQKKKINRSRYNNLSELISFMIYSFQSAGCIMGEMVLKERLVPHGKKEDMIQNILKVFGTPSFVDW